VTNTPPKASSVPRPLLTAQARQFVTSTCRLMHFLFERTQRGAQPLLCHVPVDYLLGFTCRCLTLSASRSPGGRVAAMPASTALASGDVSMSVIDPCACSPGWAPPVRSGSVARYRKVVTLTHASPDTWYTLPPVQPNDEPTSTAASNLGGPLVFGQVGRLEPRCGAGSTEVSRNNLSLVEFP
jgi:hypothetical protein